MGEYDATRARVDDAYHRMRDLESARHLPADARAAARELTAALREAMDTVTRALLSEPSASAPRRRWRRRQATRSVSPDVAAWSAELVRLTRISAWLRRTTLDDLGVHVPMTPCIDDYTATGPDIPGLRVATDVAGDCDGARIGLDLGATLDGLSRIPA